MILHERGGRPAIRRAAFGGILFLCGWLGLLFFGGPADARKPAVAGVELAGLEQRDKSGPVPKSSASSRIPAAEERFAEACRAYEAGDWSAAVDLWEDLSGEGYSGLELYLNLGNAHFKSGRLGRAILNWERAARLEPFDRDVRKNLQVARSLLADELEQPVRLPLWDWLDLAFRAVSRDLPAWALLLFCGLLALGLARKAYLPGRRATPFLRILLLSWLILALGSLTFLWAQVRKLDGERDAVILAEKVVIQSAPSAGAQELFDLHEGTRVLLGREADAEGETAWLEVLLPDGRAGWCPADALESIIKGELQ